MSTADAVRQARSPQEAMLLLAETLDRIESKLNKGTPAAAPADPWGWAAPGSVHEVQSLPPAVADEQIAEVEALMRETTDPEDLLALQAKLRLLKDDGAPMGETFDTTLRIEQDGDTATIHLPEADQARVQARYVWAQEHNLHEFLTSMDTPDLYLAFAKGGPLWLYHTPDGRNALLQMPVGWRQELIADIERDSPKLAHEVGRDLLKSEDSLAPGDAIDHIERLADNIHNAA